MKKEQKLKDQSKETEVQQNTILENENSESQSEAKTSIKKYVMYVLVSVVVLVGVTAIFNTDSQELGIFESYRNGLIHNITKNINDFNLDTEDWKTYQNKEYGFEFKYPDNSSLEVTPIPSSVVLRLSTPDQVEHNNNYPHASMDSVIIEVFKEHPALTARSLKEWLIEFYGSSIDEHGLDQLQELSPEIEVGGNTAYAYRHQLGLLEPLRIYVIQDDYLFEIQLYEHFINENLGTYANFLISNFKFIDREVEKINF